MPRETGYSSRSDASYCGRETGAQAESARRAEERATGVDVGDEGRRGGDGGRGRGGGWQGEDGPCPRTQSEREREASLS